MVKKLRSMKLDDMWSRALDLKCAWAIGNYIDRQRAKIEHAKKVERARVEQQNSIDVFGISNTQQHAVSCPICGSADIKKQGKTPGGTQRFACKECGKTFI